MRLIGVARLRVYIFDILIRLKMLRKIYDWLQCRTDKGGNIDNKLFVGSTDACDDEDINYRLF